MGKLNRQKSIEKLYWNTCYALGGPAIFYHILQIKCIPMALNEKEIK